MEHFYLVLKRSNGIGIVQSPLGIPRPKLKRENRAVP